MKTDKLTKLNIFILTFLIAFSASFTAFAGNGTGDGSGGGKDKPLTLKECNIANGAENIDPNFKIHLYFSKNVVNFTVKDNNMNCFHVVDMKNNQIDINVEMGDDQVNPSDEVKRSVYISPKSPYAEGQTYILKISKNLLSKSGVNLDKDYNISFTIAEKSVKTEPAKQNSTTAKSGGIAVKPRLEKKTTTSKPTTTEKKTTVPEVTVTVTETTEAETTTAKTTSSARVSVTEKKEPRTTKRYIKTTGKSATAVVTETSAAVTSGNTSLTSSETTIKTDSSVSEYITFAEQPGTPVWNEPEETASSILPETYVEDDFSPDDSIKTDGAEDNGKAIIVIIVSVVLCLTAGVIAVIIRKKIKQKGE